MLVILYSAVEYSSSKLEKRVEKLEASVYDVELLNEFRSFMDNQTNTDTKPSRITLETPRSKRNNS
ncbi:MAG: hypothetical protein FMNOHCHN_03782 [Ignavibacteriaceae bacterium]|nr:hypothetical protein [Ignavibacteriaceae bacterium]